MIRLIQQVCLVTMYSIQTIRICFTVGVACKTFFISYFVIVIRPGEGISENRDLKIEVNRDLKIEVFRHLPRTANVKKSRDQSVGIRFAV